MAVTATATDAVKADVLKMLKIPRARTFKVQHSMISSLDTWELLIASCG